MVELIQNTVDPMKQCSVLRVRTCLDSRQRLIRNFVEVELSHVGPATIDAAGSEALPLGGPLRDRADF